MRYDDKNITMSIEDYQLLFGLAQIGEGEVGGDNLKPAIKRITKRNMVLRVEAAAVEAERRKNIREIKAKYHQLCQHASAGGYIWFKDANWINGAPIATKRPIRPVKLRIRQDSGLPWAHIAFSKYTLKHMDCLVQTGETTVLGFHMLYKDSECKIPFFSTAQE